MITANEKLIGKYNEIRLEYRINKDAKKKPMIGERSYGIAYFKRFTIGLAYRDGEFDRLYYMKKESPNGDDWSSTRVKTESMRTYDVMGLMDYSIESIAAFLKLYSRDWIERGLLEEQLDLVKSKIPSYPELDATFKDILRLR